MTALITGAGGSIGSEISEILIKHVDKLILCANKSIDMCERIKCFAQGKVDVLTISCDISTEDGLMKLFSEAESFGSPDILINNAAVSEINLLQDMNDKRIDEMVSVNLTAPIKITKHFLPTMIRKQYGNIINIVSMWGEVGASCETVYSATKAGLIGFTKALSKEVGPSKIKVNALSPGMVESRMNSSLSKSDIDSIISDIPIGRIGSPAEIAKAVEFLITKDSSYINGYVLPINGGMII